MELHSAVQPSYTPHITPPQFKEFGQDQFDVLEEIYLSEPEYRKAEQPVFWLADMRRACQEHSIA